MSTPSGPCNATAHKLRTVLLLCQVKRVFDKLLNPVKYADDATGLEGTGLLNTDFPYLRPDDREAQHVVPAERPPSRVGLGMNKAAARHVLGALEDADDSAYSPVYLLQKKPSGGFQPRRTVTLQGFDKMLASPPWFHLLKPLDDFEKRTSEPGV